MDSGPQAAVGAGDDVFSTDDFSERDNAIAYQFRMLDELRRMAGNSRDQDFTGGGVSRRANYGLPDVKGPESHRNEFRQCSRLSCSEKLSRRKRLDYR
jgi:hypothetical protein